VRQAAGYNYLVINRKLDRAISDVVSIVTAERMKTARNRATMKAFIREHE
jgi:guanylate kinase